MTDAAIIAVAEEPNPVGELRRELTAALDLPWPITLWLGRLVHTTLFRYRQPLRDPAGLLRRLAAIESPSRREVERAADGQGVPVPDARYGSCPLLLGAS